MTNLEELIFFWQTVLEIGDSRLPPPHSDRIEETIMYLEKYKQEGGE